MTGNLGPGDGCRARDFLAAESTFTHSYVFPVQAGRGYQVNMWVQNAQNVFLQSRLELVAADSSAQKLLAASRDPSFGALPPPLSLLMFVSTSTGTDTIRATTVDAEPSDTGTYGIAARSCRVPVALITDSITHSDTINPGDCSLDLSAFPFDDHHSSTVHLYALRSTGGFHAVRLISWTASVPVRVFIGGPHDDTFGGTPGAVVSTTSGGGSTATSLKVGLTKPGDYTVVIGTDQGLTNSAIYTLTIGREQ